MFYLNDNEEYETQINGITFICEKVEADYEKIASEIAECYETKLDSIAEFLLDEDISDFWGEISVDELKKALGVPVINLDNESIVYLEHILDDEHIIEFEYEGILENFMYLNIDG